MNAAKLKLIALSMALAIVLAFAGNAQAVPIQAGNSIILSDGPGTTGGGEFNVTILNSTVSDFITFCLEKTEYISFGQIYLVDAISNQTSTSDPLDPRTAYLYYNFATGSLGSGANAYTHNSTDANALQNLIWMLEGEIAWVDQANLAAAFGAKAAAWYDEADGNAGSSLWGVQVLQLTRAGIAAQDQLVLVPEPSTLLLLGGGLIGVFALTWRQRR